MTPKQIEEAQCRLYALEKLRKNIHYMENNYNKESSIPLFFRDSNLSHVAVKAGDFLEIANKRKEELEKELKELGVTI